MLRILTYHRVGDVDQATISPWLISASPAEFAKQAAWLANEYHVVSMDQVLGAIRERRNLPAKSVLITFDDGYRDFADIAWPILKRLGLPVTLFVVTAAASGRGCFWWDRLYQAFSGTQVEAVDTPAGRFTLQNPEQRIAGFRAVKRYLKRLPSRQAESSVAEIVKQLAFSNPLRTVLDWDELRQLAREGVTVGAHTRTHPLLSTLSLAEMQDEIIGSYRDIVRELGSALPIFCYPSGDFDDRALQALRQGELQLAFSTADGHNDLRSCDPLRLRRTNITPRTTFPLFRLRLTRPASYFDRLRHSLQRAPAAA